MNQNQVKILYSAGNGRSGAQYAYVRPAQKCRNRSRRCRVRDIDKIVARHYAVVNYYEVDGYCIGACSETAALTEYWRVCARDKIKVVFPVTEIETINTNPA